MTGSELIEQVRLIIQDESFDEDLILKYLNDGLLAVASCGRNSASDSQFDLPGLEATETVATVTGADNIPLPDSYFRDVSGVFSVTNRCWITDPARKPYNFNKFKRWYPAADTGEEVADVVVRGNKLFYAPIPEAPETLQIYFIEKPEPFTFGTSPDVIPSHLQELTLCCYAAWRIFVLIEDGIEGVQVNTERQWKDYQAGLAMLRDLFGVPDNTPLSS